MAAVGLLACAAPASAAGKARVDTLFFDGKIVTVDDRFSIARAVAVRDGRIVAVGRTADLRRRFDAARAVDLRGRTVLPGFNDAHQHVRSVDRRSVGDLQQVESLREIVARVRAKAAEVGAGTWVLGYGWDETILAEGRKPTRQDLDAVAPASPVLLTRQGGHSSVANTRALQVAGITRDTPDPPGGRIERDASGEPTGILVEDAADLVSRHVPPQPDDERRAGLIQGLRNLLPFGITSFSQATLRVSAYPEWESIYRAEGARLPRASAYISWPGSMDALRGLGRRPLRGDDRLRITAVKLFADGGFTGPDAFLSVPYNGLGGFRGSLVYPPEQLTAIIRALNADRWPVGVHTAGDAASSLVIRTFARVLSETPRRDIRHHLMHQEMQVPRADIRRMRRFRIGVVQQSNFLWSLEGLYDRYLPASVRDDVVPARSLLRAGVRFAESSDIIPTDPMLGLYTAVTRAGRSGRRHAFAKERLSVRQAIRAYTMGGAYMTHQEDEKGSIERGKLADMIVLSDDVLRIPPRRLREVRVERTYVGGRLVYRRQSSQSRDRKSVV